MSSLEEINRDYSNRASTEKLFTYTSYGAQIGAITGGISLASIATYIYIPCYQKGALQLPDIVVSIGISAVAGVFALGATGAIIGTITGAAFLINDLVYNDL